MNKWTQEYIEEKVGKEELERIKEIIKEIENDKSRNDK